MTKKKLYAVYGTFQLSVMFMIIWMSYLFSLMILKTPLIIIKYIILSYSTEYSTQLLIAVHVRVTELNKISDPILPPSDKPNRDHGGAVSSADSVHARRWRGGVSFCVSCNSLNEVVN